MKQPLIERYSELWSSLGISKQVVFARNFPLFEQADDLCVAEVSSRGRPFHLTSVATDMWKAMKTKADLEGVDIKIYSAFRSIDLQTEMIQSRLKAGRNLTDILKGTAPPGCSEHHTGRAVDIVTGDLDSLGEDFELTPAFSWLSANACRFGFTLSFPRQNKFGYVYEPWHWFFSKADD